VRLTAAEEVAKTASRAFRLGSQPVNSQRGRRGASARPRRCGLSGSSALAPRRMVMSDFTSEAPSLATLLNELAELPRRVWRGLRLGGMRT